MISRLTQMLDAWDPNESLSIFTVAEFLRERYAEYARLKQGPFTRLVEDALIKLQAINPILTAPVFQPKHYEEDPIPPPEDSEEMGNLNDSLRDAYRAEQPKKKKRKTIESSKKHPNPTDDFSEWASNTISTTPSASYEDIGGLDETLQQLREIVEPSLLHPEIFTHLGVSVSQGILLHGPSGCGKTLLANALAGELGVKFFKVSAPEFVSGMSGESESKVRALFQQAKESAPCLIFLDEVDAITPKRENASREMERRIVAQLLSCFDELASSNAPVVIIGATNRPETLDPALRRAGRFDREVAIGIPKEPARASILKILSRKMRLDEGFDFNSIASKTPGYVGADLAALAKEAASIAIRRIYHGVDELDALEQRKVSSDALRNRVTPLESEELEPLCISMNDFEQALDHVQPSGKREGFATIPDVTWGEVGALDDLQQELNMSLVLPILHSKLYESIGLSCPAGVLLFGPPGCGKTLLAKAVANQSRASFISVKGPELLNKYVGESEKAVRQLFQRARASSPSIIFFDEIDSLCPRRGGSREGSGVAERVVNQLLTELDGLEERRQVFIIAATNRPDIIDPAILRPGRLDKMIYVPLPDENGRESIMRKHVRKTPLSDQVDIGAIARDSRCRGFSGADMAALVREASLCALKKAMGNDELNISVGRSDFEAALQKVFPSVSEGQMKRYDKMYSVLCCSRAIEPTL